MEAASDIGYIFRKYRDRVYRLALSIARNENDAQDIMQNTFIKIMKNLKYLRNKSFLSTWIYKIAYNEALMSLRRRKSQFKLSGAIRDSARKLHSGLYVNWPKLPDELLLGDEFKQRLDGVIRDLPIKYRMALLLNTVESLPLKQSAVILNLKINSLKTRLHRARMLIKSEIAEYLKDRQARQEKESRRCGIWTGFIHSYCNGTMPRQRQTSFKRHIKDCRSCNLFLNAYDKAIKITGAIQCQDLPNELKDRIESFILKKQAGPRYRNTKGRRPLWDY